MTNPARSRRPQMLVRATLPAIASLSLLVTAWPPTPAAAQITVFDAGNYSQNILTAARTLQQINNQIRSLQNEAQMLVNQARNLSRIDFPQLQALTRALQDIDRLMSQAQGISFRLDGLDQQLGRLFPQQPGQVLSTDGRLIAARERLDTAMAAYRHTMAVQAQVVETVAGDAEMLGAIAAASQRAEGGLQAAQATNQLLALSAKQQFQIQTLMAAQYRAQAIEAARLAQARSDARAATRQFLGSGSAYTPR